ncbi:hypothetical protein SKAU_G00011780 [Synaphobranchus kaupii]|uniref:Uncharacterized protein n=1 Tax=Synaphobranchus kaupii TaxID=118154 RepID=A0A9Q1JD11_SYNKA|nr:hypothetical protein SKAU_G00011780 [Synaphobranchus kaupii]
MGLAHVFFLGLKRGAAVLILTKGPLILLRLGQEVTKAVACPRSVPAVSPPLSGAVPPSSLSVLWSFSNLSTLDAGSWVLGARVKAGWEGRCCSTNPHTVPCLPLGTPPVCTHVALHWLVTGLEYPSLPPTAVF